MSKPIVSVIWLNYNSMHFVNIAKKSLESLAGSGVPLELILVDNNSVDGSFEVLSEFVEKLDLRVKVIRLKKNYGFTGGNNVGYMYSDPSTKYIALINNDLIIEEESLSKLINFLDENKEVGAVQGIIYDISGKKISNAGFICSEALVNYPIKNPPEKPYAVTYVSGAYMVIRREAVERIGKLFDWDGFLYFDDWPLGYRLWMHHYKAMVLPYYSGRHLESASTRAYSAKKVYYAFRGYAMLIELSNSRFRKLLKRLILKDAPIRSSLLKPSLIKAYYTGLIDGFKTGSIKRRRGDIINIYTAPILKTPISYKMLEALMPTSLLEALMRRKISHYTKYTILKTILNKIN